MKYPKLIGLYSPVMQSGKSEITKHLQAAYGYKVVKFAECLKTLLRALLTFYGFDAETIERMLEGDLKASPILRMGGVTPRRLMETLGTDWGRKLVYDNLWSSATLARVDALIRAGERVVIDDLRFPNEYAGIRATDSAVLVKVIRPGAPVPGGSTKGYEGLLNDHEFGLTIHNTGTLDDLRKSVDAALSSISRLL